MDNNNVLSLTSNLDELEQDYSNWARLPYKLRFRSDEECIKQYGCTNIQLYTNLKEKIVNATSPNPGSSESGLTVQVQEALMDNNIKFDKDYDDDYYQELWKDNMINQLEQSPNIVLLNFHRDDYTVQELDDKYQAFTMLTYKNRNISNSYSIQLFGFDVQNVYRMLKSKLTGEYDNDDINIYSEMYNAYNKIINEYEFNNDKLALYNLKLNFAVENKYIDNRDRRSVHLINESIDNAISHLNSADISIITPWFTPSEILEYKIYNSPALYMTNAEYYKTIKAKFSELNLAKTLEEKNIIRESIKQLCWNPSIEMNPDSVKFARNRQREWLSEHMCNIYNITNLKSHDNIPKYSLLESTFRKADLYPVYITLQYDEDDYIMKYYANYRHAFISFNNNLNKVVGFDKLGNSNYYVLNSNANCKIMMFVVFLSKEAYDKMQKTELYTIDTSNIYNLLSTHSYMKSNLNIALTQYTDIIGKLVELNCTSSRPNAYLVYSGDIKDYDSTKVNELVDMLYSNYDNTEDTYDNIMSEASDYYIEAYNKSISDNDRANSVLSKIKDILTIHPII